MLNWRQPVQLSESPHRQRNVLQWHLELLIRHILDSKYSGYKPPVVSKSGVKIVSRRCQDVAILFTGFLLLSLFE